MTKPNFGNTNEPQPCIVVACVSNRLRSGRFAHTLTFKLWCKLVLEMILGYSHVVCCSSSSSVGGLEWRVHRMLSVKRIFECNRNEVVGLEWQRRD